MMTKKIQKQDKIFVSNRNFTTIHVKTIENFRFLQVLFKISQIPGFYRFPGKAATLYLTLYKTTALINSSKQLNLNKQNLTHFKFLLVVQVFVDFVGEIDRRAAQLGVVQGSSPKRRLSWHLGGRRVSPGWKCTNVIYFIIKYK